MKKITIHTKIDRVEYRNTSYFGNPSYWVWFDGKRGYTAPNASCAYGCNNSEYKESAEITFHYTPSGKLVIDYIR